MVDAAMKELARHGATPCYTSQNLGEFWNVLTRPAKQNGYGLTPPQANILATDIESKLRLLSDGLGVHEEWRHLLVVHGVSGAQVHDARIAAAMHVHGVKRILTFNNRDFARFTDIEAVHPADLTPIGASK
jgi:predicted nucleic acid-binding protein